MLTRILSRRDAERRRRGNQGKRIAYNAIRQFHLPFSFSPLLLLSFFLRLCVFAGILLSFSCSSKPSDLSTLAPADSLIYLETNDLGAALQPIIDSKAFNEAAKSKPDLSPIKGVQLAVAVTGFETSEKQITDENSELNFKPHFVAIADTHSWEWQTRSFAENQLGEFINKIYGGGVELSSTPKDGGTEYIWTAEDGRKAYGFVTGSLILFGNDESSIEKVQAVRRGETDSILKTGKLPANADNLAVGYISTDGIGQISNIIGLQKAKESGEESDVQSFVARVLPQLLRGSVTEAVWTARLSERGIEDKLSLTLVPDVATAFNEAFAPLETLNRPLLLFSPSDATSVTEYNLKNPQLAWRSVLSTAQKLTDSASGKIISALSNSFFEPYGIKDGELFLGTVGSNLVTVRYDDDEEVALIWQSSDDWQAVKKQDQAFLRDFRVDANGKYLMASGPGYHNVSLSGDPETIHKCWQAHESGQNLAGDPSFQNAGQDTMPSMRTDGIDRDTAKLIAGVLSERKSEDVAPASHYTVETRFNKTGMERRLVSEFGLLGSIIVMLATED